MMDTQDFDRAERTPDESDRATLVEMEANAFRLAEARRAAQQDQKPDENGNYAVTECEECGADIPLGRLRAAARNLLCVHCASAEEARKSRFYR